ncbi:MAG: TM0996/MTH895 family glutaredoxin-like protein [Bryobacterales bacterium]|nr:TM0996/MTH895 family glutaredoxin-like protein [Bryobacterales bacterium]
MKIQILGTGCSKCKQLAANAEQAAREMGIDFELEKVTGIADIVKFSVMTTPALAVDGKVKLAGKVASPAEIRNLLSEAKENAGMETAPKCSTQEAVYMMFCCSGAADTAEIADRAVRAIHKNKEARMFCLAGIAADVEPMVQTTKAAGRLFVVDGCAGDCARKTMEKNGFSGFAHFRVTDLGWEKGKTPVTEERVAEAVEALRRCLPAAPVRAVL